jgi:hypothetical protein
MLEQGKSNGARRLFPLFSFLKNFEEVGQKGGKPKRYKKTCNRKHAPEISKSLSTMLLKNAGPSHLD